MRIEEFDYKLPRSLIAQYPTLRRGDSRLMVLNRALETIEHRLFEELPDFLGREDLIVLNDTRVIPARLIGRKETGGLCEVLLIPSWNGNQGVWDALVRSSGRVKPGLTIRFGETLHGKVEEVREGRARVSFSGKEGINEILHRLGHLPLPPYIKRGDESLDRDRYQTIFAEKDGSIAAPTAGLHFGKPMLRPLEERGVKITAITLHVGIGTFTPVKSMRVEEHKMESEWTEISEDAARVITEAKGKGKRIIAVGTTTTRALESSCDEHGRLKSGKGFSSLFIYPPYRFRIVEGLITNFHLPKSTLIMLVSAFAGKEFTLKAYGEAVRKKYRFYSYGDAMLIL